MPASVIHTLSPAGPKRKRVTPPGRVYPLSESRPNINITETVNRTNSKDE